MSLLVGSLFSGVEGIGQGLEAAGFEVAWQVEIDNEAVAVLERHYPTKRRYRDIREVTGAQLGYVDVLVGGFPCQGLSVAGLRAGLADPRSGLFGQFARLALELAPPWLLLENVPGLLSSFSPVSNPPDDLPEGTEWEVEESSDLGVVLAALQEGGYGWAYRVLDAQHFGVPQRRERVFIIGCLGDTGARAAEVLLEPESVLWDLASCLATGQGSPGLPEVGARSGGGSSLPDTAFAVTATAGRYDNGSRVGNAWNTTYVPADAGDVPAVSARGLDGPDAHLLRNLPPADLRGHDGGSDREAAAFDERVITSLTNRSRVEPGTPVPALNERGEVAVVLPAVEPQAFGGNRQSGPLDVATARLAHGGPSGHMDFETETFIVAPRPDDVADTLRSHPRPGSNSVGALAVVENMPVASSLTGEYGEQAYRGDGSDNLLVAQALTAGSHPGSHAPGRRREDDVNLVPVAYSVVPESGQGADLTARQVDVAPAISVTDGEKQTDRGVRIVEATITPAEDRWAPPEWISIIAAAAAPPSDRPHAFNWQAGGGNDESFRGGSRQYIERAGDYAGALSATRVDAVAIPISADAAGGRSGEADTLSADAEGKYRLRPPGLGIGAPGDPSFTVAASGTPAVGVSTSHALTTQHGVTEDGTERGVPVVGISENQRAEVLETPYARQLTARGGKPGQGYPAVRVGMAVRRLMPIECERLMGWPDDHTRFRADGTELKDGPRYRLIGNGVVAPVAAWIGRRLAEVMQR